MSSEVKKSVHSPKISVLLIIKNAMPIVLGTLDSLKQQTFKDFEVVVVDGASTDGTLAVLYEAARDLPLSIVSEPDHSLAEGLAKGLRRATGDIVGILCADERYNPNTLGQVSRWFEAEPDTVACGGKVDFIEERGNVVDSFLTPRFDLLAHLACELVPAVVASFFNRLLIGEDFYYSSEVPTCPDYEFWARVGFRFPASAFNWHPVSVAQAFRTRDSMSFRAESFAQMCRDKLVHLNNLLAKGYVKRDIERVRRRASAGIHMWAAEQLRYIEHDHPDILAHCAQAACYDKSYQRIAGFIERSGKARYDAETGIVTRSASDLPGPRSFVVRRLDKLICHPEWAGAAILSEGPLTIRTSTEPWGYSAELPIPKDIVTPSSTNGKYWINFETDVVEGSVGIGFLSSNNGLIGEQIIRQADGRANVALPLSSELLLSVIVRSGGIPSSLVRINKIELLYDPDKEAKAVLPIELPSAVVRMESDR